MPLALADTPLGSALRREQGQLEMPLHYAGFREDAWASQPYLLSPRSVLRAQNRELDPWELLIYTLSPWWYLHFKMPPGDNV